VTPERMREIAYRRGSTSGCQWIAVQDRDGEWAIEDETGQRIADRIKRQADAEFIVHARGLDIADLLGELAASQAHIERLTAAIERHCQAFEQSSTPGFDLVVRDLRAALDGAPAEASGE